MAATKRRTAETAAQASGEGGAGPVLDLDHLRTYTMGSPELEHELLGIFLTQMREYLAGLRQARGHQDWKFAAHTLKGAARALGADRVAQAAEELERVGFEASADDKAPLMSCLEDEIVACEQVIRGLMA